MPNCLDPVGRPAVTSHLLPVYARADIAFERGEGVWLYGTNGERYLDFSAGVAVNALGYAHPHLVAALCEQAGKVWHVSNLYRIPEAERLAQRLCEASFADLVSSAIPALRPWKLPSRRRASINTQVESRSGTG